MKSVAALLKICQTTFNEYVRLRDKGLPCISCDAPYFSDFGHLFKVSIRPAMRFNPGAAHGQCRECNSMHDGNYENFCEGIAARYGVEFLTDIIQEANNSRKNIHKWSRTEIEDLILFYKNEIKKLKT